MEEEILELKLPELDFLCFGNIFSGNYYDFNFKIFPKVKEEKFEVYVWVGFNCLEKSEVFDSKEFEMTEQGRKEAQTWVLSEFESLKKRIG